MHVSTLLLASTTLLAILPAQQQPGPAIDVEQTIYTASFSANGAEYRAATAEVGPPPQLRLRYLSAGRSHGNLLSRVVDAVPERRTNRRHDDVHFHHGTVTEQYRIDGVGFEQSFEFEQRPDGSGDLVIAIEVSGNVRAEACEPQHRDLHFRTDQGGTIRYGEAIAFDRRGERIEVQTAYDGAGTIRLVVPADFVDRAAYPLVVDPTVGVALSLSTFGPSRYPDLAFDVGSQRHLVAWLSSSGSTRTLRATLVSSDGVFTLSLNNIASGSPGPFAPAVASCRCVNGNAFLIVWQQSGQIRGRLIDADTGSPRAAEFVIDNPSGGDTCRRPTVSSADGIGMIVAWDRTFSGELLPRTIRSRELYWANAATAANVSIGPQRTLRTVTSTSGYVQNARLARSSHARWVSGGYQAHCRLVWERFYLSPAPGDYDIETCAFRTRPAVAQFAFTQTASPVPGASQIGSNEFEVDIGSIASTFYNPNDQTYLIAYQSDGDVFASRYDDTGAVGSLLPVRATAQQESRPRVGTGTCEFTVAYMQTATPSATTGIVHAARVLRDGTVATSHVLVDGMSTVLRDRLAISTRPIDASGAPSNATLMVWETTSAFTGVIGRRFEPIVATLNPFGQPCPGPLGEMPTIGSVGGNPVPGNSNFELTLSGAPATSLAVLVVSGVLSSNAIPGAPGCTLYIGGPLLFLPPTVTSPAGSAATALQIPCSIPNGFVLGCQWGIYSPTANAFGWIVSNDIDIRWLH